jgi:hypothetical protein
VGTTRTINCAALGLALATAMALWRPAAAQVTFGSPGDPPRIALGAGAFDMIPSSSHHQGGTEALLKGEYRFGDVLWAIAPFVGASGTTAGAVYAYGGFGVDINFGRQWVLTPNAAIGYFYRGRGTNLGSWFEFRTGAELDYRFANNTRLGVTFHHISNAGLTKRNPGEEEMSLVYTVPLY